MRDGDDVLLYLNRRRSYLVSIKRDKSFHTHKGYIEFNNLIGKGFGSRVLSSSEVEFFVFKPALRDYIFKAQRKTQILYPKDVALATMFSGISAGSKVVEAGTGAGALTTALAFYVKPTGRVYSYEVRPEFQEVALRNLRRAKVEKFVELKTQDITAGIDESNVDAVVLDLATPWLATTHAYSALKGSGSIVSFSPTVDQVVKTVEALYADGFADIGTFECLMRGIQAIRGRTRPQTLMTGHTGYLTYARKAISAWKSSKATRLPSHRNL